MTSGHTENDNRELPFRDKDTWADVIANLRAGRDYVTYDEILSLLPEVEEHLELLDELLDELGDSGVSVVENDEAGKEKLMPRKTAQRAEEEALRETGDLEDILADDVLSLYLAQMAQEPLLTHRQEIDLARQIEMGRQAQRTLEETDYTAKEYGRLRAQVEAGQAAREQLGRANTRLVVSIAKRYRGSGVPFTDLIQNGNVGLMRAVDRYDYRTGNRFSTYATWWIRQAVTRSLANHGRIVRIPVHTGARMRAMIAVAQRLEKERGERPTPEEIAVEMEESPEKIRQLMRWAPRPLSLEQPAGSEGDAELGQFIPDDEALQPGELIDERFLNETLVDLMRKLAPREALILRLRYGLQDGESHTLKEIGDKLGLSRERVRQIEHEAIAKIRLIAPDYRLQQFLG